MSNQFDIATYIKYNNNLIKNLKQLYESFSKQQILYLKNILIQINTVQQMKKMFLQIFIKHNMVLKEEVDGKNQYIAKIEQLSENFNQYNVKIYIDLLEQVSKYLKKYVLNSNIEKTLKEQLLLIKEKFPERINGVYNIFLTKTQEQLEYEKEQNQKNVLNLCIRSIVDGQQFLNQSKMLDSKVVDGQLYKLNNIELMESSILGEKHLGLAESNVKTSLVDGQTYEEVNRIAGFYNNGDLNKSNGLGFYD